MTPKKKETRGRKPVAIDTHKLQVRISEDAYQVLKKWSDYNDTLPSTFVREMIYEVVPTLESSLKAYDDALEGRTDALYGVATNLLAKAVKKAEDLQGDMFEDGKK